MSQIDDTEQVRRAAEHVVEAFLARKGVLSQEVEHIDAHIDRKIETAVSKMKFWVVSAVLTQIVALLPMIFFLGGIYSTNNAALEILKKQQSEMDRRGTWMHERERWEQGVETYLIPKGFNPPRYRQSAQ